MNAMRMLLFHIKYQNLLIIIIIKVLLKSLLRNFKLSPDDQLQNLSGFLGFLKNLLFSFLLNYYVFTGQRGHFFELYFTHIQL